MVTIRRRALGHLAVAGLVAASIAVPAAGALACPAGAAPIPLAQVEELAASGCALEGALLDVDGAAMRIPAAGEVVLAWSMVDGGEPMGLGVETAPDGTVRVLEGDALLDALGGHGHDHDAEEAHAEDAHDDAVRAAGALPALPGAVGAAPHAATAHAATARTPVVTSAGGRCADRQVRVAPGRWQSGTMPFVVNTAERRPSNIGASAFRAAVSTSLWVLQTGQTSGCGTGGIGLRTSLSTTSSADAAVTGSNGCGAADGRNVVDFGPISGSALAITCVWMAGGRIYEADTRVDTTGRAWTTSSRGCRSAYDLQGILTHELGHAVGLAHQPERGGADQTMSASARPCEFAQRLLGGGDLASLRDRY